MTMSEQGPEVADFGGLDVRWDRRVLQPRPWTAAQSRWAAELAVECPDGPILELFCGAGQIGLLVATLTGRPLIQVDIDPVAATYARHNASAAGMAADVRTGSIENALGVQERVALAVVDPPWVPTAQVVRFPEDPVTAIDGGPDGTAQLVPGIEVALRHLLPGGRLVAQVGHPEQVDVLRALLADPDRPGPRWCVRSTRDHRPDGILLDIGVASEAAEEEVRAGLHGTSAAGHCQE